MLQGVTSFQDDTTPTCGLSQSSSVMPIARNIARAGARLLVAEDNDVNTLVLQAILKKYAINADFVVNGDEALSRYSQSPGRYHAILMDCEMPVMSGFQATEKIRAFERENCLKAVAIIALTAHALLDTRDACMACGMNDILTKPISFPALLSRLEALKSA